MTEQSLSSRRLASRAARTRLPASCSDAVRPHHPQRPVSSSALGYASTQPGFIPPRGDERSSTETTEEARCRNGQTTVALNTTEAPAPSSSIPATPRCITCSAAAGRSYGVGVGREGLPPARRPSPARWNGGLASAGRDEAPAYLPRFMAGTGTRSAPARIRPSEYRIHGTMIPRRSGSSCRRAVSA